MLPSRFQLIGSDIRCLKVFCIAQAYLFFIFHISVLARIIIARFQLLLYHNSFIKDNFFATIGHMSKVRHLNILPPTLLLAISALLSRVLGLVRDHLLAKTFGATAGTGIYDLDVYYAAFRIPDLIYNLLVLGVVSAAFIPIFTQYNKDEKAESAWKFASSMLHLMFIAILLISGLIYLLAPHIVPYIAGGFFRRAIATDLQIDAHTFAVADYLFADVSFNQYSG